MSPQPPLKPSDQAAVWTRNARQWARIGPPLRPSAPDLVALSQALDELSSRPRRGPFRAALLGVTPEIAGTRWPSGTELVAIDHSFAMIQSIWAGAAADVAFAVCADWRRLPIRHGTFHLMVGDGSFNVLGRYDDYGRAVEAAHRALVPGGRLVLRFFVRPDRAEPVESVVSDLVEGRIGNFHVFKWRLAMAVHGDAGEGVGLADIWRTWSGAIEAPELLADRLGWPREVVATIEAYRDSPTRYTFPTRDQIRAAFDPCFRELKSHVPSYELGERCPSIVFAPR